MITGINETKYEQMIYHANVNVNLVLENVIQIKSGTTRNVNVSVKIERNIICTKNPATCSCKNGKYLAGIIDDYV